MPSIGFLSSLQSIHNDFDFSIADCYKFFYQSNIHTEPFNTQTGLIITISLIYD